MDEDGFTEVKKKGAQWRQGAPSAGGRASSHAQQKRRANQNVGGRRGAQVARSNKNTHENRKPDRGGPVQSKPGSADRQPVPQPAQPRTATVRASQASVPAGNLVSSTKSWTNSRSPRKESRATPPPHRRVGLCFAQVVAQTATSTKTAKTSVLSIHSTPQTPASGNDQTSSPAKSLGNALAEGSGNLGATNGTESRASTPSATSAHTSVPRRTPRSWADALSHSAPSKAAPAQQRIAQDPPVVRSPATPRASKQALPPSTGHPSLRVNTQQPTLAVQSATPTTTAAPSISSAAAAAEPGTDDSVVSIPLELASLVCSEAREPFPQTAPSSALRLLRPLGLLNPHNMCFCNAPLQALLATSEFAKLMEHLATVEPQIPEQLEVIKGLAELALRLDDAVDSAISLEPIKKIVEVFNRYEGFQGEGSPFSVAKKQPQLDAALLYSTIVDLAAENLTTVLKALSPDDPFLAASKDGSEWKTAKRKGNEPLQGMHLVADQRCTPFAEGFRGLTAMTYRAAQRTSVTLEPFSMLHVRPLQNGLDTVEAALGRLFERGMDDSQQPGSHQTLILELPKVLVVHIARFTYEEGVNSTVKVKCPVHHPLTLHMQRKWFTDNAPVKNATYNLVAKVVHKGEKAANGHYVTVAKRCEQWVTCDDAMILPASEMEVKEPNAYMLFYEQCP